MKVELRFEISEKNLANTAFLAKVADLARGAVYRHLLHAACEEHGHVWEGTPCALVCSRCKDSKDVAA